MNKLIDTILGEHITISGWMKGFMGILFVRYLIESLSSPTRNLQIPSNPETVIHYTLYWLSLTLGLILIIGLFNKNYLQSAKLALFGLPMIWVAPFVDIIISHGKGFYQSYILDTGKNLLYDYFTFYGPNLNWGFTYGVRIEIAIVLIFIAYYLRSIKVSVPKIFLCLLMFYTFGFILGSWPAIIYTILHINHSPIELKEIYRYFFDIATNSTLSHNTLYEGINSVPLSRFFELSFDKLACQILFIISFVLSIALFWKLDKNKLLIVTKNIRWERVGSYLSLLLSGAGFAYLNNLGKPFAIVDLLGITCLLISWLSLWMYAVHCNDIIDIDIDKISNKERPLARGDISVTDMRETGYIWLALSLVGSYCAGFYPFYMSLVYTFASYIYSNPPLRLRRFPFVPSFLIGICSLATILAGYFFISVNKQILSFPIQISIGIILMAALAINVKDMKDIEGDKKNGVTTVPVLFGKWGPQVTGGCFALSFLLVPYFLSVYILYAIAIPAALIGYGLVLKKPFKEEPVFILRFIFLLLVAIIYGGAILFLI